MIEPSGITLDYSVSTTPLRLRSTARFTFAGMMSCGTGLPTNYYGWNRALTDMTGKQYFGERPLDA